MNPIRAKGFPGILVLALVLEFFAISQHNSARSFTLRFGFSNLCKREDSKVMRETGFPMELEGYWNCARSYAVAPVLTRRSMLLWLWLHM